MGSTIIFLGGVVVIGAVMFYFWNDCGGGRGKSGHGHGHHH